MLKVVYENISRSAYALGLARNEVANVGDSLEAESQGIYAGCYLAGTLSDSALRKLNHNHSNPDLILFGHLLQV